jgi:NAD(P)-dependent dehydrogenase (short-subunit alcohol dehydrogenase family)
VPFYSDPLYSSNIIGRTAQTTFKDIDMRLEGKVAIITGAGQTAGQTIGNGRATALLFARQGAKVLITDRDPESLSETHKLITEEGLACASFEMDVTREQDCIAMSQACMHHWGRIDILHNNVGIGANDASVSKLQLADWQRIMQVNLTSMFLTCKSVLPQMREQASGSIINISSLAATAATNMVAYKTSKAGVMALTDNVALTNARHGIRANCILPGLIDTPMAIEGISASRGIDRDDLIQARNKSVPLRGKMGSAWDVAHAALFLASDDASFITGIHLRVDGGQGLKVG